MITSILIGGRRVHGKALTSWFFFEPPDRTSSLWGVWLGGMESLYKGEVELGGSPEPGTQVTGKHDRRFSSLQGGQRGPHSTSEVQPQKPRLDASKNSENDFMPPLRLLRLRLPWLVRRSNPSLRTTVYTKWGEP